MATTVARLQAVLSADTRDFDRSMGRSEGRMSKVGKVAGVAGLAIGGALVGGMVKSVGAAKEAQVAQVTLESALRSSNISVAAHSKEIDRAIQKTSKLAAIDDEDLSDSFAKLVRSTGNVKDATEGMNLATDIARARHVSLEAATKAVERAYLGSATGLRRFGVVVPTVTTHVDALKTRIDELKERFKRAEGPQKQAIANQIFHAEAAMKVAKEQDKAAMKTNLIAEAQKKFAGSAAAYGESSAAAQERVSVAVENLEESLGKLLLPAISAVATAFADLAGFLEEHEGLTKTIIASLGILAGALLAVSVATKVWSAATKIATAAQWLLNAAIRANPIGIIITLLVALGLALVVAWKKSETFRAIVTGTWNAIKAAAGATAVFFRDTVWPLITKAIDLIQKHPAWLLIKTQVKLIVEVVQLLIEAFKWVRDNGAHAIGTFWAKVQKPLNFVVDRFSDLKDFIESVIGGFKWILDNAGKVAGKLNPFGDARDPTFMGLGVGVAPHGPVAGVSLMGANAEMLPFAQLGYSLGLHTTSGLRPGAITRSGNRSDHAVGKALDMADGPSQMAAFFRALIGNPRVKQAFYDPLGSIFGGQWNSYREGGHSDHVHVATYDKGGWLRPGWNLAYNGTGRPEAVGAGMPDRLYLDLGDLGVVELVRKGKQRFEKLNGPGSW